MRISDWSSDVCSSDLSSARPRSCRRRRCWCVRASCARSGRRLRKSEFTACVPRIFVCAGAGLRGEKHVGGVTPAGTTLRPKPAHRSEEHTSELQSLMRSSYAVFCLKKKKICTEMQDITTDSHCLTDNMILIEVHSHK